MVAEIRMLNPADEADVECFKNAYETVLRPAFNNAYARVPSPAFNHNEIIELDTLLAYFTSGPIGKGAVVNAIIAENDGKAAGLYLFLTYENRAMAYVLYCAVKPKQFSREDIDAAFTRKMGETPKDNISLRLAQRAQQIVKEIYGWDVPYISDLVDTSNILHRNKFLHLLQRKAVDVPHRIMDTESGRAWGMVVATPEKTIPKELLLYALISYENMMYRKPIEDNFGKEHKNVRALRKALEKIEGDAAPLKDIPPMPVKTQRSCSDFH